MDAAGRLLAKLRRFVSRELDDEEAVLFSALLAPGVASAYSQDEVQAFGAEWGPEPLPEGLAAALREGGVRVSGLGRDD